MMNALRSLRLCVKISRQAANKTMSRIVLTILFVVIVASCSSRVVYEPPHAAVISLKAININTATADELEKLPHIGRKTAESIVEHRKRHGAFRRVEHLMLIRGVSETRFVDIRPLVRVE